MRANANAPKSPSPARGGGVGEGAARDAGPEGAMGDGSKIHPPTPVASPPSGAELPAVARPYISLQSGRALDLLDPDPAAISLADVAAGLAKISRWTGHTRFAPYSVAQHSIHVKQVADALCRSAGLGDSDRWLASAAALLHDAHEHATNDINTPMKRALEILAGTDVVRALERRHDAAIHAAFGLPWPLPGPVAAIVKRADAILLATEIRDQMAPMHRPLDPGAPPAAFRIAAWSWHRAETAFIGETTRLVHLAGGRIP